MASWVKAELEKFGVKTDAIPLGKQEIEGQTLDLPPAIVGRIGDDPKKKTILIYGHFDVQPVRDLHTLTQVQIIDHPLAASSRPTSAMAGTPTRSSCTLTKRRARCSAVARRTTRVK